MSEVKQVKVDNWGIYFLQRLKHFFNRTDYCDLTLQFQDNAQLKVHRLVLNACTEYFELLERTCEMYEDCLVMPDDLQADVVVPIVNFMYTGHLEFKMDILERLYQTSQILNMPVLSKLLESHRNIAPRTTHSYSGIKRLPKPNDPKPPIMKTSTPAASTSNKRSYSKAFVNSATFKEKRTYQTVNRTENINKTAYCPPSPVSIESLTPQKLVLGDPRPTRYEIPEELDTDNVFDNSFCSISYTSQPLMVHPDTVKRYKAKRTGIFGEASCSKKPSGMSTVDIVECKRISSKEESLFDDSIPDHNLNDDADLFHTSYIEQTKDSNQLFDQILDPNDGPKVTIETKDSKAASNLDHARIISEVLKKYPHLVKSNKNIKLKILDSVPPTKGRKQHKSSPTYIDEKPLKLKSEEDDFTYETDVIDSKQAAKLIALGAENTKGPWICLICGTPGKALHFNSYYKFRRHLVEVHNEKPVSNICEYCGLRSLKRNYLLHHLYAQHGVQPPPQYHFPKCNLCSYIALTEGLLVKHKLTHKDIKNFRCNVCSAAFASSSQLLVHIQNTGHKYSAEKKSNLQCIYCLKVFLRETNLYAHIKTHHKKEAKNDCIIEDSDEEKAEEVRPRAKNTIKFEPSTSYDNDYEEVDVQYQIQQRPIGEIQVVPKKQHSVISNSKQKILNPGFGTTRSAQKPKPRKSLIHNQPINEDFFQEIKISNNQQSSNNQEEEIVLIDNNEYIMRDNQLIPRNRKSSNRDYTIADMVEPVSLQPVQQPSTSMDYSNVQNTSMEENLQQPSMIIKKSSNLNQPIQIVVSNEEEYKALMASNHPIIFDNSDANKTLTVLTAPHHNTTIETTTTDLDNTQSSDMMILPHEYPLNDSETVPTDNSNIVVVYSHPVDDQNKQFQIITTGIGAQFVQSSAIITQNFETVTTSSPAMNMHCIVDPQMDQTWENDVQSLEEQQIQLPPNSVTQNMLDSNQVQIKQAHCDTGNNNLDEFPEVNLAPKLQKSLEGNEPVMTLIQPDVNIKQVNQPVEHEMAEELSNMSTVVEKEITTETTTNELTETHPQSLSMPHMIEESMEIEDAQEQEPLQQVQSTSTEQTVMNQQMETENIIEQQIETQNFVDQPMESGNLIEESTETENAMCEPAVTEVMEQLTEIENIVEQPTEIENAVEHPTEIENVMEQPHVTNITEQEQPIEPVSLPAASAILQNDITTEQESTVDSATITEYPEDTKNNNLGTEDHLNDAMESQAYDDIVEVTHVNNVEPVYVKKADEKIQNLTSEWSEDEYDVAEDSSKNVENDTPMNQSQNQTVVAELPENDMEESIENIQEEMKKTFLALPEQETEESAISSQEEDSSQDMQLPPLNESPVDNMKNPEAQEKISSLLNDWDDNDSQEENITADENIILPEVTITKTQPQVAENDSNNCLSNNVGEEIVPAPKEDNIKSLVSDWDDDDEETKK